MTLQGFISKLNWRHILLHFVAFWLFIYGCRTLSNLGFTKLIDGFRLSNYKLNETLANQNISSSEVTSYLVWYYWSAFLGLLVAFCISLIVSFKRHWFWPNTFIILLVTYALHRNDLLGWEYLNETLLFIGRLFNNSSVEFLLNGSLLLMVALLIFFLKPINRFIERGYTRSITAMKEERTSE